MNTRQRIEKAARRELSCLNGGLKGLVKLPTQKEIFESLVRFALRERKRVLREISELHCKRSCCYCGKEMEIYFDKKKMFLLMDGEK